ncbi:AAA family ATPase [Amycolatopsis lurida]
MADWREEAARAVVAELGHARDGGGWLVLGKVRPLAAGGWYAADLRGRWIGREHLVRLCVAGAAGGVSVPVEQYRVRAGVVRLRVAGPLPRGCDRVWAEVRSPRDLRRRVADGLLGLENAPLADRLAAGELDPVPEAEPVDGLNDEQAAAYRACLTPGVRLVWAPPGTGATRVLTKAVEDLAEAGKSVLVLSADEELAAKFAPERPPVNPELASVLDDLAELDRVSARLSFVDEQLAGYDHEEFRALAERIEHEDRIGGLEAELAQTSELHRVATGRLEEAQAALRAARVERGKVEYERGQLAQAAELITELERLTPERHLSKVKPADRRLLREQARVSELIEEHLAAAHPITDADITRLDEQLAETERALDEAARVESDAYLKVVALRRHILKARANGAVSEEDRQRHADQKRRSLAELHEERETLRAGADDRAVRRKRLEKRLVWLTEQVIQQHREFDAETAATKRVLVTNTIPERDFDVVLVDRAAALRAADAHLAVARARETAALVGDFRLPGPEVRPAKLIENAVVRTWLATDVFAHCGIKTREESQRHEGCVVLRRQYTGERALANAVGYGFLDGDHQNAPEVVLVDTLALPELCRPYQRASGWSPIGGLLAGRLTEIHGGQGESFGLLTGYPQRLGVELAAVRDADPALSAVAGTARALAGLRFDAVAVDLLSATDAVQRSLLTAGAAAARERLYLLADLGAVKAAPIGSALGAVNALRLQQEIEVRQAADLLAPGTAAEVAEHLAMARESVWLWAPWSEEEVPDLLPAVAAAVERGVDVYAVLRPDGNPLIRALRGCGVTVVRARTAHRKIAVIDRRTVLFGATHLPMQGERTEALVVREGPRFARKLLADLPTEEDRHEHQPENTVPAPRRGRNRVNATR